MKGEGDEAMTTALDRLSAMIDERDEKIEELTSQIADLERQAEEDRSWSEHRIFDKDPSPDLPVPRLEIRWKQGDFRDGYELAAEYSLVYKHFLDKVVFVPLGHTRRSGAFTRLIEDFEKWGWLDTPFRDGCHFANEMRQLKLRGFVIAGDKVQETFLCAKCGRAERTHDASRPFPDCAGFEKAVLRD